ncbi:MAG: putative manganese transporter [Eubacteriales bacterium]|nr:putative manganese transporter [Eubacteriales bacterium]
MILDALKDSVIDTVKLLPFLFAAYLAMEYWEDKAGDKTEKWLRNAGPLGPIIGSVAGVMPQCGFSALASSLYAGGVITAGTLLAVFLSTSDEMLPIFISEQVPAGQILKILGLKVLIGAVSGLIMNALLLKFTHRDHSEEEFHELCEEEHCECEEGGIVHSALVHTVKVTIFIFIVTFIAAVLVGFIGKDRIMAIASGRPILGVFFIALIGLIPNCAASVIITQLFLDSFITAGQMMAGLLVGAGVGLLVLFRTNRRHKENFFILVSLYALGVFWGIVITAAGIKL